MYTYTYMHNMDFLSRLKNDSLKAFFFLMSYVVSSYSGLNSFMFCIYIDSLSLSYRSFQ